MTLFKKFWVKYKLVTLEFKALPDITLTYFSDLSSELDQKTEMEINNAVFIVMYVKWQKHI